MSITVIVWEVPLTALDGNATAPKWNDGAKV